MKRDCLYVFFVTVSIAGLAPMNVQFSCHIEPWCRKPSVCLGRAGSRTCLRFVLATSVLRTRARLAVSSRQPQTRSEFCDIANSLRKAVTHAVAGPCSAKSLQTLLVSARFTFCGTAFGSAFKERSSFKERSCPKRAKTLPCPGQNLFTASNM